MRIGLVSSMVPHINGGYRFIVEWLDQQLRARGHEVEIVYLPNTDDPDSLLVQMNAFRLLDLDSAFDRVITFRPPAHVVRHRRKVVWFIHHIRVFYDLWDTKYRDFPDTLRYRALRDVMMRADTAALQEAHRVFTNSHVVSQRLRHFNGIEGEVLYPPVMSPERFVAGDYGDEIVCVCRMEPHKRQHLLVQALGQARSQVRLRLCGRGFAPDYVAHLRAIARDHGVADRLTIEDRWISEDEKAERLSGALASAYVPFDEDSYGYPTIEAAHAARCTVTVTDSGGVPEFVKDGVTGMNVSPDPAALADAFDRLHGDRALAQRLGEAARAQIGGLGIEWDTVVAKLLS